MEIKGFITEIGDTGTYGNKGFRKRQVLIKEDVEKYPQTIPIDFIQDKCDLLDQYAEGQLVTISINIRANEYNGKHYVSLQGWKISGEQMPQKTDSNTTPTATPQEAFEPADELNEEEQDNLPF